MATIIIWLIVEMISLFVKMIEWSFKLMMIIFVIMFNFVAITFQLTWRMAVMVIKGIYQLITKKKVSWNFEKIKTIPFEIIKKKRYQKDALGWIDEIEEIDAMLDDR